MKTACLSTLLLLVSSFSVVGLPGCGKPEREFVVLLNLLSEQGTPEPIDAVRIIVNGGESEALLDFQGQFAVPLASSGQTLTMGLRFPESDLGQEVFFEIIGLQNGVDVLSGETTLVFDDSGSLNNVFVGFCGNEAVEFLRDEECDDANGTEGDGCDSNCTLPACGNGVFSPGEFCFAPATFLPLQSPKSVGAGDMNADGNLDLVVGNSDNLISGGVRVFLGDGSGQFSAQVATPVEPGPGSLAVGDLDGDGDLDVVTSSADSDTVSVLLNDGGGQFAPQIVFDVGSFPKSVSLGDLDNDSDLDIVTANFLSNNVSILLNDGLAQFSPENPLIVGEAPFSVAIDDLDSNGNLDIVVANRDSDNIGVLLNNGSAQFRPQANFSVKSGAGAVGPVSVILGDWDGDSDTDVATANKFVADGDSISILINNGLGQFALQEEVSTGEEPSFITTGDFDKNTHLDLVTSNSIADNLSIVLNDGLGQFEFRQSILTGNGSSGAAVGDFNGDQIDDIVSANLTSSNLALILSDP